jgi:septum formation protein
MLARLGVEFRSTAPDCDESFFQGLGLTPEALALRLANEKAASVARRLPECAVLGSDQLVEFEGRVLGKPGTADRAVDQLLAMAGKPHRLITAVALHLGDKRFEHTEIAVMTLRPLTRLQAERYVAEDQPLDCAGSYKFEAGGIRLFHSVAIDDPTAIIGLPLLRVEDWLRLLGFP